jgi:hypothetical protein
METAPRSVDREAILRHLNLNPRDVNTQALLLICERYQLDPLLKHVVLISGRPYITRDGYLTIAHRSGVFDGIEVVAEGENDTHWTATVAVYRKDMSRPFRYGGRYPRDGHQKLYGPEMAVKVAEVMAMRRAFCVTGVGAADERWDDEASPANAPIWPGHDDASAVELGWKDAADMLAGHNEYVEWGKAAEDEVKTRAKQFKDAQGIGWPMSLSEMETVIAAGELLPDDEDEQQVEPS